ncbi:hypothetical protein BH18ACI5_BH18ACI5_05680 [soil metagenome]
MADRDGEVERPLQRLFQAGLLTAVIDGLFACVSSLFYGSTPTRVFQGVASTLLGPEAFQGGARTALFGVAMHVAVAFWWSAVFLVIVMRWSWIRRALQSPGGRPSLASVYGPSIWLVMSLAVIPLLVHRPPSITVRWWIQLLGHIPFVGLPIVISIARGLRRPLRA